MVPTSSRSKPKISVLPSLRSSIFLMHSSTDGFFFFFVCLFLQRVQWAKLKPFEKLFLLSRAGTAYTTGIPCLAEHSIHQSPAVPSDSTSSQPGAPSQKKEFRSLLMLALHCKMVTQPPKERRENIAYTRYQTIIKY